ncbi:LysR family transcriptional regulator [Stappia sp. GBMRC 2046]|uniref:LysR family transcriptional regulator n=1 Tax=Stappia sediminis TaxID=2692190 RepID=A0A7X3LS13_9HYPH|nr:LysR family transcriptional regulator [Stappia sediminis]MXN64023.1 LysR family transcriptional regulator [Stappia sediminis]
MIPRNLRHLRLFLAVADLKSLTLASQKCRVTQPAVSQAIGKMETAAGGTLFERTKQGFFLTSRGEVLAGRVARAFAILDPALSDISQRLCLTMTFAQLQALIAVRETENYTLAARRLGVAQPTVHRAVSQIEREAKSGLFKRTSFGIVATRACQALTQAARLAICELDQADSELAERDGRDIGRIVIGALPLSRSALLPEVLVRFRKLRPNLSISVLDGPYDELLAGLRRGEIDFLLGALRDPAPIGDIRQRRLFDDSLVLLCGRDHPLAKKRGVAPRDLASYPWIVPRTGTPTRLQFDALYDNLEQSAPIGIIESGSILLMREMLNLSDHLGCISRLQAEAELSKGLLVELDFIMDQPNRPIGMTTRHNWIPTAAQQQLLDILQAVEPCRDKL